MASLTQWTWVWVNSERWWWTGSPGVLQSMKSQRVGHSWVTELNWRLIKEYNQKLKQLNLAKIPRVGFTVWWTLLQTRFCSVAQLCPTLFDPMDCSTPAFPVLHYLPEFAQTHICWTSDVIQQSHSLLPPSPLALNLSPALWLILTHLLSSFPSEGTLLLFSFCRQGT